MDSLLATCLIASLGVIQVTKVMYETSFDEEEDLDKLEDGNKGVYLSECEG